MKFKNKTNSHALWIEEAKYMIVWDEKNESEVTDKKAIKYLQEHGFAPVGNTYSAASTSASSSAKKA